MTEDAKGVQDGAVSTGAASSGGASTPAAPATLTKEDVAAIVKAAVDENTKRLKQSFDDKLKAQRPTEYGPILPDDADPDVKAKYYEGLIKRQQAAQTLAAQQEQQRLAAEQFATDWQDSNTEFLVSLGIDPQDKKLDWGDGKDYLARQKKLQTSASKLIRERLDGSVKEAKKQADEKVAKAAVDAGLESNTTVAGSSGADDEAFTRDYNAGRLNSPADHKRAREILAKLK